MGAEIISLLSIVAVCLFAYMSFWFVVSAIRKRNDVADIAWGLGFVFAAAIAWVTNSKPGPLAGVSLALTTLWGVRLATHIYLRNQGKKEDFRYAQWRKDWGAWFYLRSFLQVFLLQGVLLFTVVLAVVLTVGLPHTLSVSAWALAGIITWLFGFYFETIGDWQLSKFIANKRNKGKIMDQGLWQYTRHPNYFGEVTQWWGLWLVLCATDLSSSVKLLGLISPMTITTLILFVSGVPLLEKRYAKDPAYQKYAQHTNKFFPWSKRS